MGPFSDRRFAILGYAILSAGPTMAGSLVDRPWAVGLSLVRRRYR